VKNKSPYKRLTVTGLNPSDSPQPIFQVEWFSSRVTAIPKVWNTTKRCSSKINLYATSWEPSWIFEKQKDKQICQIQGKPQCLESSKWLCTNFQTSLWFSTGSPCYPTRQLQCKRWANAPGHLGPGDVQSVAWASGCQGRTCFHDPNCFYTSTFLNVYTCLYFTIFVQTVSHFERCLSKQHL